MAKIVIFTNVSLDGVVQDPTGQEGFRHGGWFVQYGAKNLEEWAKVAHEEALGTEALLLGRRSDEWFAERWQSQSGERADTLNSMPKYVVSSTLEHPQWKNSTVLKGDVGNEVSKQRRARLPNARPDARPRPVARDSMHQGRVPGTCRLRLGAGY